jgi:hypothetical protein
MTTVVEAAGIPPPIILSSCAMPSEVLPRLFPSGRDGWA